MLLRVPLRARACFSVCVAAQRIGDGNSTSSNNTAYLQTMGEKRSTYMAVDDTDARAACRVDTKVMASALT